MIYDSFEEKKRASEFLNQALALHRALGDSDGEATTLHNLMFAWEDRDSSLAIFFGKQAVNRYQQLRSNIKGLEKELQRSFLDSKEDSYRSLADLLISQGRLPEAEQVLALLKEEEYFDFVRRDPKAASLIGVRLTFTPAEAELEKRYSQITDRIAEIGAERGSLLDLKERTPDQEKRLSELEAKLEIANQVFQKFLDQLQTDLKRTPRNSNDVGILRESQALKDTLRELDAVALYTIVAQDKYHVILITPDVEKAYEYKISGKELNKKISAFREALQNPNSDPRTLGQDLYRILVGPELARDISQTRKQTVLWSLDGSLRYLPMAALYDGQKYLVENYRNVVITLASREHLKDSISPKWEVLGLGVSRGEVIKIESKDPLVFPPLTGVLEELSAVVNDPARKGINKGVLPGKVMLDDEFTLDAMKIALRLRGNEQPFKLVHIASHFKFEPGDETQSFLLLGNGKTLKLSELKNMSQIFSRVELLTLSACNTATGGSGQGKEVEGFAVLAQRQGAEAIIASLWPVSDPSTSRLMRQFYLLREEHPEISKAESMRQAQLSLLNPTQASSERPYTHPYFWAPFILIGNWR